MLKKFAEEIQSINILKVLICFDFSSHFPTWAREKWFWTVFFRMSREILIIFSGNPRGKLHLGKAYFQASFSFRFVLINITWAFCFKVHVRNLGLPKPGAKIPWLYLEWNPDSINKQRFDKCQSTEWDRNTKAPSTWPLANR